MSDNTLQFEWIVTIKCGLEALFRDDPNVFVAGDLLWYAVEGEPTIRTAPDAMVVFGRPKGYRGSYKQWEEGNIPPQVVFEVLSPGNRMGAMVRKFRFYERYGVEEYYLYNPDLGELSGWLRSGSQLKEVPEMSRWVSPRLKVRFDLSQGELKLIRPDEKPFATYLELAEQLDLETQALERVRQEKERERQRAERLEAQLRKLGVEPEV